MRNINTNNKIYAGIRHTEKCDITYTAARGKRSVVLGLKYSVKLFLTSLFIVSQTAFANPQVSLSIISAIESNNNPTAISYRGAKYGIGLYQISAILLKEYNNFNRTSLTQEDLFNPAINEKIARWYLTIRIPQMLRYYKKPVSLDNILISYNAGISFVVKNRPLPRETVNYIKKYERGNV